MRNTRRARVALFAVMLSAFSIISAAPALAVSESCLPSSLKSKLAQIRSMFGSINVVSANRPGAMMLGYNRASYHASCQAVDFVPPPGKYEAVIRWLHANHGGGVGRYTCMNHIHIDAGPSIHFTKCR
jgi:uncharacterized protein YcbK (DUF882 family)